MMTGKSWIKAIWMLVIALAIGATSAGCGGGGGGGGGAAPNAAELVGEILIEQFGVGLGGDAAIENTSDNLVVLGFSVEATDENPVNIDELVLDVTGTIDAQNNIQQVALIMDDGDQTVAFDSLAGDVSDPTGDDEIVSVAVVDENGEVHFVNLDFDIDAGEAFSFFIAIAFNQANPPAIGSTLGVSLADVIVTGPEDGNIAQTFPNGAVRLTTQQFENLAQIIGGLIINAGAQNNDSDENVLTNATVDDNGFQMTLTARDETVRVTNINVKIVNGGAFDASSDIDTASCQVYRDTGGVAGERDGADTSLGATVTALSSTLLQFAIPAGSLDIAADQTVTLVFRVKLNGNADAGETFRLLVNASNQITAAGQTTGLALLPTFASALNPKEVRGALVTLIQGTLNVTAGGNNNDGLAVNVLTNGTSNNNGFQINLAAANEAVRVTNIALAIGNHGGTAIAADTDIDLASTHIYKDTGTTPGQVDGSDVQFGTCTALDAGTLNFSIIAGNLDIAAATSVNLVVRIVLNGAGDNAEEFEIQITQAVSNITAVGTTTSKAVTAVVATVEGGDVTLIQGTLNVTAGGNNNDGLAVNVLTNGTSNNNGFQINLAAANETVRVTNIALAIGNHGGTAIAADTDIDTANTLVFKDTGATPGQVDGTDVSLGATCTALDAGTLNFAIPGGNLDIAAATSVNLVVRIVLNGAGDNAEEFEIQITQAVSNITAVGTTTSKAVTAVVATVEGGDVTLIVGNLAATAGPQNGGASNAFPNATLSNTEMQLNLAATNETVRVTQVVLNISNIDVSTDITAAGCEAFIDAAGGGAGAVDGTDTALGSTVTALSPTQLRFAIPAGNLDIAAATSVNLVFRIQLNGSAVAGENVVIAFASSTQFAASGITTGKTAVVNLTNFNGGTVTLIKGALDVSAGGDNGGANQVVINTATVNDALFQLFLDATLSTENINVTNILIDLDTTTTPIDTADIDVSTTKLFIDANSNGIADDADTIVQTCSALDSDTLQFAITGSSLVVTAGGSREIVLRVVLGGSATPGELMVLELDNATTMFTAVGVTSGQPIDVSGGPVTGGQTKIVGTFGIAFTANSGTDFNSANTDIDNNATDQGLLTFVLNSVGEVMNLTQIKILFNGTGDPDEVSAVKLYQDNGGVLDAFDGGDTQIGGSQTFTAGVATFSGAPLTTVASGGSKRFYVLYSYSDTGVLGDNNIGETTIARLDVSEVLGTGVSSNASMVLAGSPVDTNGRTLTFHTIITLDNVTLVEDNGAAGTDPLNAGNPNGAADGNIYVPALKSATAFTIMRIRATADDAGAVTMNSITLTATGTGQDNTDVSNIKVYHDVNKDGLVDGGDTDLTGGVNVYPTNNGSVTINFNTTVTVPAGVLGTESVEYIVQHVYNGSTTPLALNTFKPRIDSTTNYGVTTLNTVKVLASTPLNGSQHTMSSVFNVANTNSTDNVNTTNSNVENHVSDQASTTFTLEAILGNAGGEGMEVDTVKVNLGGTGAEVNDIASVKLWRDGGNNSFGGDDTLLGTVLSGAFAGNVATFTLADGGSSVITEGVTARYFLSISYADDAGDEGHQFTTTLDVSEIVGHGTVSGRTSVIVVGSDVTGNTQTILTFVTLSTVTVNNFTIPDFSVNVERIAMRIRATADNAGAADMTAMTATASTANISTTDGDDTVPNVIRLYTDNNADGLLAGETELANGVFGADDGTVAFSFPGTPQTVPQAGTKDFIVVYVFNVGAPTVLDQFQPSVAASTDFTIDSGNRYLASTPIFGARMTTAGHFDIDDDDTTNTLNSADAFDVAENDDSNIGQATFRIRASNEDMTMTALTVTLSGTIAASDVTAGSVTLWRDDGDDAFEPGGDDVAAAPAVSFVGTLATFALAGAPAQIADGVWTRFYVSWSYNDTASEIENAIATVNASSFEATGDDSSPHATAPTNKAFGALTNANVVGNTVTIISYLTLSTQTVTDFNIPNFVRTNEMVIMRIVATADNAGDVSFNAITLTSSGTGDDMTEVSEVKIYTDPNKDGNPADGAAIFSGATFAADNGTLACDITDQVVPAFVGAASTREYIVVYIFNNDAPEVLETFRPSVAATANFTIDSGNKYLSATPLNGAIATARGNFLLANTDSADFVNTAALNTNNGVTNVGMMTFTVTANGEAMKFEAVNVTLGGTPLADADISAVKIWHDADDDNTFEPNAHDGAALASATFTAGSASFTGFSIAIANAGTERFFVSVDLIDAGAIEGETLTVTATSASVQVDANADDVDMFANPANANVTGRTATIISRLTLSVQAVSGFNIGNFAIGTERTVMRVVATADEAGNVVLQTLTLTASGSGDDMNEISNVRVYTDPNKDGDPADGALIAGGSTFNANNGTVALDITDQAVNASQNIELIVVYIFNNDAPDFGDTFTPNISASTDFTVDGNSSRALNPGALAGATVTTRGSFTLANTDDNGNINTAAQNVANNATNVAHVTCVIGASGENQTIESIQIQKTGSTHPVNDIVAGSVRLWQDVDDDDNFEPSGDDAAGSLSNGSFDASGLITFDISYNIAAAATQRFFVSWSYADGIGVGEGETGIATVVAASIVSESDPANDSMFANPANANVTGATVNIVSGLTIDETAGQLSDFTIPVNDNGNRHVMRFRATADDAGDVLLQALTVTASGSMADDTEIAGVEVFTDPNGDGDPADAVDITAAAATFGADNGTAAIDITDQTVPQNGSRHFFVRITFAANTDVDDDVRLTIAANTDFTVDGNAIRTLTGTPDGALVTCAGFLTLDRTAHPQNGNAPVNTNRGIKIDSNDNVAVSFRVSATDENIGFTGLTVAVGNAMSGGLTPASHIMANSVQLYVDDNNDGLFDAGDDLLATDDFVGPVSSFTLVIAGQTIAAAGNEDYLLIFDLDNPSAAAGLIVELDLTGFSGTGATSAVSLGSLNKNTLVLTDGGTGDGANLEIEADVAVITGTNQPAASGFYRDEALRAFYSFNISNPDDTENVTFTALNLTPQDVGDSIDESSLFTNAWIYRENGTTAGFQSSQDTLVSTASVLPAADGNDLVFGGAFANNTVNATVTAQFYVVGTFNGGPAIDDDMRWEINATTDITVTGVVSSNSITVVSSTGAADGTGNVAYATVAGNTHSFTGDFEVNLGPQNGVGGDLVYAQATNRQMLQLRFFATGEDFDLERLVLSLAQGDRDFVNNIRVYHDNNNDGLLDGGDTLLDTEAAFAGDDTVTFDISGGPVTITSGQFEDILVVFDYLVGATGTYQLELSSATGVWAIGAMSDVGAGTATALSSTVQPVAPFALQGPEITVVGRLTLDEVAGTDINITTGQDDILAHRMDLIVDATDDINVDRIIYSLNGTINEQYGLSNARLYVDTQTPGGDPTAGNGSWDANDTQLGSTLTSFTDNGDLDFQDLDDDFDALPDGEFRNETFRLFVIVNSRTQAEATTAGDGTGTAVQAGKTIRASFSSLGNILAEGTAQTDVLIDADDAIPYNGPINTIVGQLSIATHANNNSVRYANPGQDPAIIMQMVVTADAAEAIDLTAIKLTALAGTTANEQDDVEYLEIFASTDATLDGGDTNITTGNDPWGGDADGADEELTVTIDDGGGDYTVPAGATRHFFVVYDMNGASEFATAGEFFDIFFEQSAHGGDTSYLVFTGADSGVEWLATSTDINTQPLRISLFGDVNNTANHSTAGQTGTTAAAIGAFHIDGDNDVVLVHNTSAEFAWFQGDGAGALTIDDDSELTDAGETGSFDCATGDFDKNGSLDWAVANTNTSSVSVLLNSNATDTEANQTFAAPATVSGLAGRPQGICAGDFDQDGDIDLCVTYKKLIDNSSGIQVLSNNGNGTFAVLTSKQGDSGAGGQVDPLDIVAGDFNGDSDQDIAVVNGAKGTVFVYLGNGTRGDSTFGNAATYNVGVADGDTTNSNPRRITKGDFNKDGKTDLAVTLNADNGFQVLLNNGSSTTPVFTVQTAQVLSAGGGDTSPVGITSGDFNADGTLDLAIGSGNTAASNDDIELWTGNADGTFTYYQKLATGDGDAHFDLQLGDLDNDGLRDLVVVSNNDTYISRFLSNIRERQDALANDYFSSDVSVNNINNDVLGRTRLFDVDRDGDLDAFVATYGGTDLVHIFENDGGFNFGAPDYTLDASGDDNLRDFALLDANLDGKIDIMVMRADGDVQLYTGNGTLNTWVAQTVQEEGSDNMVIDSDDCQIEAGDFNRDGRMDVILMGYDADNFVSVVQVLTNDGDNTFTGQAAVDDGDNDAAYHMAIGDLDNDGNLDVVLVGDGNDSGNCLKVTYGDGDGTFTDDSGAANDWDVEDAFGEECYSVALGDMDQDGWLDIVVLNNTNGSVDLYVSNANFDGDGDSFTDPTAAEQEASIDGSNTKLLLTDLNRDGILDVVLDYATGIESFINTIPNGDDFTDNAVYQHNSGDTTDGTFALLAGDLDNDGVLEIVTTADSADETITIFTNDLE